LAGCLITGDGRKANVTSALSASLYGRLIEGEISAGPRTETTFDNRFPYVNPDAP